MSLVTADNYFADITINTVDDLDNIWAVMKEEGFFGRDGEMADYYWDATTENGNIKAGEHWFSNGVVELKLIASFSTRLYNFRGTINPTLGRIAAAVK